MRGKEEISFAHYFQMLKIVKLFPLFRNWDDYSGGFGRLSGEFWLGLENIHLLTDQKDYELKVELVGWNNKYYTSYYDNFRVQVWISAVKCSSKK